jgi:ankyrin repeat protein
MTQSSHGFCDFLIHTAVINGRENIVRWLIDNGMPVDVPNNSGVTALLAASKLGKYNIARLLVEKGANVNVRYDSWGNCTPLHLACATGDPALVQLLIENGADINARTSLDSRTPLHWAVYYQHNPIVELLFHFGADLHIRDSQGYTAAGLAAYECYDSIYEFLKNAFGEIISLF